MKKRMLLQILCMIILAQGILSACSRAAPVEISRISEEELSDLRTQYPYNDERGTADIILCNTFAEINSPLFRYHAVVVLVLDEIFPGDTTQISPLPAGETLPHMTTTLTGVHGKARVELVLWGDHSLENLDSIILGFGSTGAVEMMDTLESFCTGGRYVCFLSEPRLQGELLYYPTSKETGFFLTENDVVLSMTSAPGPDSASGMYLSAFEALVNETLGEPDAELTPVVPEQERE